MIIKFLKKKFNSIKICAVFTATCFIVSTLGANLYAVPMADNAKQKYEDVFNRTSSISNEYGKITSSKDAQSDITVINIQDLHCHPQTQRNIAKIIGQIADKYNLKKIYVEGGYDDIDVSWLGSIKDENIKNKIIEELVEEGILTGSEYYKLTSKNENVELKGIDERKLHQDNINRLSWIIENQNKYKELGKKINQEINFLEQRYVNIRNKRFNSSIEDYLSGKIDTRRFYRQLLKYVKDINSNPDEYNNITAIRLEDYPNISKFMTLRKVSKNINVRDVSYQLQAVINELKSSIPYNVYTQLLKETDNFSDSQKVVELITLLCEKEGIDLDNKYRALSEFLKSNGINRELNTVELVYEERQLITEIRKALSYNNEEYEITFVSDFSRYFQDYLEYKLTDADWKYFESGYEQFRRLYGKYATVDRIKEIESDIAELNKYYEINDIRNEVFVNNLLQDEQPTVLKQAKLRQDEEILKQSKEVIIAVTGGFHSQALEDILQAKEVNTIVITPSIFEGIEKATKQYKGIIKEQSKEFQHQALAYALASCSDSVVYKRIKDREQVPSDYAIVREEDDGSVVVAEHFQKRILLNAVVRILGTKDVAKIREVLEPIMGKEALKNLEEDINNLEDIGEKFDTKYEPFKNAIDAAVDTIVDSIQTTGKIVFPDQATIDRAMTGLVTSLISVGQIYFSDGVIFEIENSEFYGKDLAGVPAELYSRMMPTFQRALLLFQTSRTSTVPLNTSSLESDDKIIIVQSRQAADGKTENYDEELSLTIEDLLYIGLNDNNDWTFLTSESVADRAENLRERKKQTGILSKAEKKLKENQVPNYTGDVVDLRIKLKKAQLNKQVVYLSDIFGRQVLIKRKDSKGKDVYCEAIIKYNEETRQWELVPFEEINARYKSIEDGLLSKIEDFTKQFEGKTPEEILKEHSVILQLIVLAVIRGYSIEGDFLDNKTITLGGVKGYFAEYLVKYFTETYLSDQYRLAMPIDSNQEGFDLIDKDGYRIQIKAAARRARATDELELDIVGHALHKFKGIPVFATSEIAGEYKADTDMVFSYGLSHDLVESIAKVAFDILDNLTPQEKEDLKTKAIGKVVETRYLSEFLKDKDLEERAQQERANDEQEEVSIRGNRNKQQKAAIKTVDDYVYQGFIDLLKSKLGIADEQVTMQPELNVEEETQQEEIQQEETATPKRSKLSIFDSRRGEGKIFDFLDATAPLWEELYRFVPTVLSIGLYSVAILPFLPALGWTAIPITIGISFAVFNMFQRNFIKKHIITDWLKTKDSDIEEIKTWKEFLSFLYERIKIYTFEIFPSKLEKEQFENFYKNDDAAVAHRNGLMVPTIGISLPYLILICAMTICSTIPSFQIVMIVTLVASLIHYANNKLIETGFSLFPKEKEKQKDLRYIRGRLQYVRLLLEYPQLKNNLPVITSGPRAEKYGVETLKERRAEYLEQFESIRQKLIKEAEKDHPKIKQELILMDAKKVSETINAIDKLLPIFEEIDNIVDLIEEYKDNYEGARETGEIEKAFFIFVSDVLSTELMSIYDTKVTGDHVRRMVAFANVLGEIAYPDASLKFRYRLMLAALFHDIGKNLIPDSVLNSQNGFDATEKHIMDFHSVFGDIILRASILQKLGYFAGNHHAAKNAKRGYSYESKLREISEQPIDFKRDENDKAEDDLILEIIALADVYEALSPKLSMDSERLYQLPSRIESIKNILAALDFRGNLTEQNKAVKLLEEIAAIEQEKDETTKQKKEKEFVEKVLYSNNTDSLLMYIRNKNEDLIRNRAFKIIFTQDQNTLFDLFEEDKDKFIKDLTANPEIVKIMSLELIDWTKFEFDEETIGAFLEFYFTSMDVDINNQIIDEMGYRKKENAVSLYIRNAILNFRKRQRERQKKLQRILSKYTPVKLSIVDGFTEREIQAEKGKQNQQAKTNKFFDFIKGVFKSKGTDEQQELMPLAKLNLDFENINEYYDVGKDKIEQNFIVNVGDNTYFITLNIVSDTDIYFTLDYKNGSFTAEEAGKVTEYLGIDFKVSDDKKSLYLVKTDNFNESTKIYPLNEHIDISFQDTYEPVSFEFNENVAFSDSEINAIKKDTGTTESVDICLDDYLDNPSELQAKIKQASENNELIVIHFFRNNNYQTNLTYEQILSKYAQVSKLIDLFSFYGQDSEFLISEILKNAFVHGNFCKFEEPIAFYIKVNNDGTKINKLAVYNKKIEQKENMQLKTLAAKQELTGQHFGIKRMKENKNYDYVSGNISLDNNNFYKASAEFSVSEEEILAQPQKEQSTTEIATIKLEDIKKNFFTGQRVLVVLPNGNTYEMSVMDNRIDLNVGDGEMYKMPLDSRSVESLLGIKLRRNDDGETVSLIKTERFKEGTEVYVLDDADVTEIEPNVGFTEEELDAIYSDTGTEGYIDIYLDEDESVLKQKVKEASDSNKLLVFHLFEAGAKTENMTYSQIFKRYKTIASLMPKILDQLFPIGGEQMITKFGASFYLREMLKNALIHGNLGKLEEPIAMYIKLDNDGTTVQKASVYNKVSKEEKISNELKTLAISANLTGEHMGIEIMRNNALREYDDNKRRPIMINNIPFYRATINLLPYVNQAGVAWEKAYFNKLNSPSSFWYDAILPENMGVVNAMLQQGKNAFAIATKIAFKEFFASLETNFVYMHQSAMGRLGAQKVARLANKYEITEEDTIATKIVKSILGIVFKGASIVKHITIDYRFIKASGISEAIKMFGNNTYLDEDGNVHIPPVMIVDNLSELQYKYELRNTGIKVNGNSIYQVGEAGMLIYGAQAMSGIEVTKALNNSQEIKDAIEGIIREKGYVGISVEVEGVIQEEGEGVNFEDGITIIGNQELQGRSIEYVNGFVSSALEIKRSMGVMYSQKAFITLKGLENDFEKIASEEKNSEKLADLEKQYIETLTQVLKQGRARKIITKEQYEKLIKSEKISVEEIIALREIGIEIYVDSNETGENLKEKGIMGQIIREDGKISIYDYYSQEETEVEEISKEGSLIDIESKLVNSQKPILIDIKDLSEKFQKENILGVYKGLNTLIGNIKVRTGLGSISQADIENLTYNIDYNKIPNLGTLNKEQIKTLSIDELIEILNIAENSEIRIILKAIRKNQNLDENGFVNIIKERILAKAVLTESNKEFGLKDKKMEILLGKMLLKQLGNNDKQNVNIPDSFTGEKDNVIKKIMEETDKAMNGDEVAINTIIEIILVYGDSYKDKQMTRELNTNDARNYRAMMAAA